MGFLIAGIFAMIVNKYSSYKPAKIAADCSPVEALNYTGISARPGKVNVKELAFLQWRYKIYSAIKNRHL